MRRFELRDFLRPMDNHIHTILWEKSIRVNSKQNKKESNLKKLLSDAA